MILRRSALTFAGQAAWLACTGGVFILLARVLGPAEQGRFGLLFTLMTLATTAAGLGLGTGAVYRLATGAAPAERITANLISVALLSGAGVVAVLTLTFLLAPALFRGITPIQFGLAVAMGPLLQLTASAGFVLLGLNRPVEFASLNLLQMATTLLLQGLAAAAGQLSSETALAAWLLGGAAGTALGLGLCSRHTRLGLRLEPGLLRELSFFGLQAYLANSAMLLVYRLDILILNAFTGLREVGYYIVAVSLGEVCWYLSNSVALVLFPQIATMRQTDAVAATLRACRLTLLVTAVAVATLYLAAPLLVTLLYGPALAAALPALRLLLPGILALTPAKVISSYMNGSGKPGNAALAATGSLPLSLALDFLLIPGHGIEGAAAATSLTYLVTTAISLWLLYRETGAGPWEALVVQAGDLRLAGRRLASVLGRVQAVHP